MERFFRWPQCSRRYPYKREALGQRQRSEDGIRGQSDLAKVRECEPLPEAGRGKECVLAKSLQEENNFDLLHETCSDFSPPEL